MIATIGRRPGGAWRPSASATGVFASVLIPQVLAYHKPEAILEITPQQACPEIT